MKAIKIIITLICIAAIMTGCSAEDGGILDLIDGFPQINTYQEEEPIDYTTIGEDEYDLRLIIEAYDIHKERMAEANDESGDYMSQYGAEKLWQENYLISLDTIEDMEAVFGNPDFKRDFKQMYGINFDVDKYYLPRNVGAGHYDIDLVVIDNHYYLSTNSSDLSGGLEGIIIWGVYQSSQAFDVSDIAQLYAEENNDELHVVATDNGTVVYYFTVTGGCTLFDAMNVRSTEPTTAYMWSQDGVLGIIIRLGEYEEENLNLCVFETYEIN